MTTRLEHGELDRLFPFHLVIGSDLTVLDRGSSLARMLPELVVGAPLSDHFTLERPSVAMSFEMFRKRIAAGGKAACTFVGRATPVRLRGELLLRSAPESLVFLGSPRVKRAEELVQLGLTIADFAAHDAIVDFLLLVHAQETTLAEAQAMAEQLRQQRSEVRDAHNRITTLYVVSRTLAESPRMESGLGAVVAALGKGLGCESASLWLRRDDRLVCRTTYPYAIADMSVVLSASRGLLANVFTSGQAMWESAAVGIDDGRADASGAVSQPIADDLDPPTERVRAPVASQDKSVYALPIRDDGAAIGVISLMMPTTIQRSDDVLYLLERVGDQVEQFVRQRRLADELGAARDAALENVRMKTEFLANVSHELRTPLGAMIGLATALRPMLPDKRTQSIVDDIQSAGQILHRLVDDLLDESRMEAGKLTFEHEPFGFDALVRATIPPLRSRAHERGLSLQVVVDSRIDGDLLGDRVRIGQVVTNLVGNAIKFTDRGNVSLHITVGEEEQPNAAKVTIVVADTGIGIAADQIDRVFEPFTQGDGSTARRYSGAGLGLTIVRNLVTLMGGTVSVQSTHGKGSTFTVTLRLERAPSTEIETAADLVVGTLADPKHILVVEDNVLGQRATQLLLEQLGHRVEVVDDGAAAIQAVARRRFDLVLMDCHLPGLDGFEATRQIRALPEPARSTRIVACTASVHSAQRQRCIASGMDDVITKPLSSEAIRTALTTPSRPSGALRALVMPSSSELFDHARVDMLRGLRDAQGAPAYDTMLALFREHAPAHAATLEAAARAGDSDAVRLTAHSLRGMALNVGAKALALACATVETAATSGRIEGTEPLHDVCRQTLAALPALSARV